LHDKLRVKFGNTINVRSRSASIRCIAGRIALTKPFKSYDWRGGVWKMSHNASDHDTNSHLMIENPLPIYGNEVKFLGANGSPTLEVERG
jgi:hypothetical protein